MTSLASLASPLVFLQLKIISCKQTPLLYNPPTHTHYFPLLKFRFLYLPPPVPPPSPAATGHHSKAVQRGKVILGLSFLTAYDQSLGYWPGSYSLGFRWSPGFVSTGVEYSCSINLNGESWACDKHCL